MLGHGWRPPQRRAIDFACAALHEVQRGEFGAGALLHGVRGAARRWDRQSGGSSRQCSSATSRARQRWASASTPRRFEPSCSATSTRCGRRSSDTAAPSKFIGDAVVGIFGVPVAHEDDALRAGTGGGGDAGRAARLNEEFERGFGLGINLRIGVNTGEVVTGEVSTDRPMATGDP